MASVNQMSSINLENDNSNEKIEASDNNEQQTQNETPLEVIYHET